jgi:hypothetical protein
MSVQLTFEEHLPHFEVTGSCELSEGTPPGGPPTKIIRTDQPWSIKFDWKTTGALNYVMSGTWLLRLYLEQMGGKEIELPEPIRSKAERFMSEPCPYTCSIQVPAGCVPEGVYMLVAAVTMVGPTKKPGPIAGFAEFGVVQFFEGGTVKLPS